MEFVTEYTDYARSVLSHNEATTEKALHEPVKRFLDRIKPDVQEMILKDTLPTNFPCLQELYPASRRFYVIPGQLSAKVKELENQARDRVKKLILDLRDQILDEIQSEITDLETSCTNSLSTIQSASDNQPLIHLPVYFYVLYN
jgi:hypothetical protein